jgi:hypothetical protein
MRQKPQLVGNAPIVVNERHAGRRSASASRTLDRRVVPAIATVKTDWGPGAVNQERRDRNSD